MLGGPQIAISNPDRSRIAFSSGNRARSHKQAERFLQLIRFMAARVAINKSSLRVLTNGAQKATTARTLGIQITSGARQNIIKRGTLPSGRLSHRSFSEKSGDDAQFMHNMSKVGSPCDRSRCFRTSVEKSGPNNSYSRSDDTKPPPNEIRRC